MHIVLLNWVRGTGSIPSQIHELHFDSRPQDSVGSNITDLVVVDARDMDTAALNASIVWVARLRNSQPVRKAIMVCCKPPIEFVVRAIRAGINDIFERPLSGRQIYQLLARHQADKTARRAARSIMLCGRLLEATAPDGSAAAPGNILTRERQIEDIQKSFAAESSRLEHLRETLHLREAELLTRARRLDEEFARMQGDGDLKKVKKGTAASSDDGAIPPGESDEHLRLRRAEAQLKARGVELDRRETALATRDRMLREFEAMLLSQAQAPAR